MANRAVAKENTEDCFQWLSKGKCSKGDSCTFRHQENHKEKRERKEIEHDLLPETQTDLLQETAKVPQAKDQQVSAHPANRDQPACYKFMLGTCPNSSGD